MAMLVGAVAAIALSAHAAGAERGDDAVEAPLRINVLAADPCRPAGEAAEDIVVCGNGDRRSRYQLPMPEDRGIRVTPRVATGGGEALVDPGPPIPSCSHPDAGYHCAGNLDLLKMARVLGMIVGVVPRPDE